MFHTTVDTAWRMGVIGVTPFLFKWFFRIRLPPFCRVYRVFCIRNKILAGVVCLRSSSIWISRWRLWCKVDFIEIKFSNLGFLCVFLDECFGVIKKTFVHEHRQEPQITPSSVSSNTSLSFITYMHPIIQAYLIRMFIAWSFNSIHSHLLWASKSIMSNKLLEVCHI